MNREQILEKALREVYWLVDGAHASDRFGSAQAEEVKELRSEVAQVLAGVEIDPRGPR